MNRLALLAVIFSARVAFAQAEPTMSPAPTAPSATTAEPDADWNRALDALVSGDLDAALAVFDRVAADETAMPERRAAARDLGDRIRKRRAVMAAEPPAAASAATPAPASAPAVHPDRDDERAGRTLLLGASTAMGLGMWGWMLPTALDIQSSRGYVGLYMLTAGASFGAPFLLTRTGDATWGMASMTWIGGTRGALAGVGVGVLIDGAHGSPQGAAASALGGSVVGAASATYWAHRTHMTPGHAHATSNVGDIGALSGLAFAYLTGLDQHDKADRDRDEDLGARMLALSGLGGYGLGFAGGHLLAARRDFTWGDAEVMRLPIALGVNAAAMVMLWGDADFGRPVVGALVAGGLLGAGAGEFLVRDRDFGVGQGFLLDLGTVAGALGTMGGFYLVTGKSSSKAFVTSSFVGGTAVFSALYLTLDAPAVRRLALRLEPRRGADGRAGTPHAALLPLIGPGAPPGLAIAGSF